MSITWKEGIRIAEENGIGYDLFRVRVKRLGWDKETASTQTPMTTKNSQYHEYYEIARKNGISKTNFRMRLSRGMKPELACRKPLKKNGRKKLYV